MPNLDYFGTRYYSGEQGRFLSVDPLNAGADLLNPQSWNAYSYVGNNPLVNVDPTGESFWSVLGNIFSFGLNVLFGGGGSLDHPGGSTTGNIILVLSVPPCKQPLTPVEVAVVLQLAANSRLAPSQAERHLDCRQE